MVLNNQYFLETKKQWLFISHSNICNVFRFAVKLNRDVQTGAVTVTPHSVYSLVMSPRSHTH